MIYFIPAEVSLPHGASAGRIDIRGENNRAGALKKIQCRPSI
ncbi:Hypothetical protein ETEE_2735 [Edwardsiella anguillarum ET080813]|uniref:Uncharacterized protein n=1 Tax=Edwardsiella anguillarum ET080813 TaxID=667120 RepID=A0A076LRI6_9GAMM|nr:Hypothetical protein ETEE_2735 [Edwardsiella anguillarum ET080813]